jgi:hypothetical protein
MMRGTRDIGVHICHRSPRDPDDAGVRHDIVIDLPQFEAR